ncbi:MAG: SulP family inorganic anion transporter [Gammaproteobacteria bacterium]
MYIALTSRARIHLTSIDEQAVVILAGVGMTFAAQLGAPPGSPELLINVLALMSLSSILVALAFFVVGRLRLTRLLELLPFPVICGFMAGVGWLLLNAAVFVTVDVPIGPDLPDQLRAGEDTAKLLAALGSGVFLVLFTDRVHKAWAFPVAAAVVLVAFYAVTMALGWDRLHLLENGWLFDIASSDASVLQILGSLSLADVDLAMLARAAPELLTIVFLALLSASLSLSALSSAGRVDLDTSAEVQKQGVGNLLCAAVGSPPGYTDVAGSVLYRELGASGRLMPLVSSLVTLAIGLAGAALVGYLPKVLVGATIFLFAYRLMHEWLFRRVRGFQPVDFMVVCIILAVVIFVDFMVGILTGVVLTLLLFVMRYSMISAIHGRYSLREYRSSVERPLSDNKALDAHGQGALVYTLRGFLFFGTANSILERIKEDLAGAEERGFVLLDFKRVTGIDISAINTFLQIKQACEEAGVRLLYSAVPMDMQLQISALEAVSSDEGRPLFFDELDFAVEYTEEALLKRFAPDSSKRSVREQLEEILNNPERVDLIMHALERIECVPGEVLFSQGERDDGFYILESGALSAYIEFEGRARHRVKKFGPGSLIGELSMFIPSRRRTATVVAEADSVLYYLSAEVVSSDDLRDSRLTSAINELIARALGMRINYMNHRLMLELE